MSTFSSYFKDRLSRSLPGFTAQKRMMPVPVDEGPNPRRQPPSDAIASGVMALIHPNQQGDFSITLTVRSDQIEQGGQICLPGGRAESLETPLDAALRETEEEIGVHKVLISVLGHLTPLYVNTSNSLVHPTVGFLSELPPIRKDPYEVSEVFHVQLDDLAVPDPQTTETWQLLGRPFKVPYWDIHEVPLWGATAMMLAELMTLYSEFNKS
jgi:8-oxo-dGTP pyrophosphatase MutT (NUDIX family)